MALSPPQDPAAGFKEVAPELSEVLNDPVCERNGTAEWTTSARRTPRLQGGSGRLSWAKARARATSSEGGRVYRAPGSPTFLVCKRGGSDAHRLAGKSQGGYKCVFING